jgi:hypothetical protein
LIFNYKFHVRLHPGFARKPVERPCAGQHQFFEWRAAWEVAPAARLRVSGPARLRELTGKTPGRQTGGRSRRHFSRNQKQFQEAHGLRQRSPLGLSRHLEPHSIAELNRI